MEEIGELRLRAIEALAVAIEARHPNTRENPHRVSIFAVEIGNQMGLEGEELEALRVASLLHDIGTLAVPDHILAKPGRLTPEEFEKVKIHPAAGAEILEGVQFPYPVVPIVRAHHEKWDGTGYPAGLRAQEIPLGARILAAVDCLHALASTRPYRPALPLDQAMDHVANLSGKSFDPAVVAILQQRYVDLERRAQAQPVVLPHLSSMAAARQETQLVFQLKSDLGSSLNLDETLSLTATRLRTLIPYDSIAVYICKEGKLAAEYASGEDSRVFSSLLIPMGEGLSGRVAESKRAILNGNPSTEQGYLENPNRSGILLSALIAPLEGLDGIVGVLALYAKQQDAFSRDHLRILLTVSSKIALSIENALKFRQAESSAGTDYLTGLANARSLYLRLETELARCGRMKQPLTVFVGDLDGFKQINDRYGHLEGNKVLRRVAEALRDNCREYDYVARMGGDEFVLLLPGIDREASERRIPQFRQIAAAAGKLAGAEGLSMSIGEAYYPQDGMDAEQLLSIADRRMYLAKQSARAHAAAASSRSSPGAVLAR